MRRALILPAFVLAAAGQVAWLPADPAAAAGPAHVARAATSALVYDYHFAGTHGTVGNSAPGGPAVKLKLSGAWSPMPGGVQFSGNTTGKESVAAGKPASGDTLNVAATEALGFGAKIRYEAPSTGTCFKSPPNVTQAGRYTVHAAGAQAKLQLSNCGAGNQNVFPECRFSGSASAPSTPPVVGTTPLVNGAEYNLSCVKAPDRNGHTVITVQVTRLSTGTTSTNKFTIGAVGSIKTTQYLSAGNEYPLPKPADNTSQFVGGMSRDVYCAGPITQVQQCLAANLPS